MGYLTFTVRWLTEDTASASYHGDDWPPSPLRLYQALVASARRSLAGAADKALEHLALLPAPTIWAPHPQLRSVVRSSVPNNDGDNVVKHFSEGRARKARDAIASQRTLRERAGWRLDAPVHYVWAAGRDTESHLPKLEASCSGVTALGQGVDLAWVTVRYSAQIPELQGLRHEPAANAQNRLKIPYPGVLQVLDKRYNAFRRRVGSSTVTGVLEPRHLLKGYRSPLALPTRRSVGFALRTLDDEPWSASGDNGMVVAAMVRHAVHLAAQRAGLDKRRIRELMGHGGDGRIQVWPAPNVGHEWADGRIRRVLLACSEHVPEDDWMAVLYRLGGADLCPLGAADPVAMLIPTAADDPVLWRYNGKAQKWTTATPVVLPGFDTRRGKPRPARAARRMLQHADIPEELVEAVDFEPAAQLSGVFPVGDYRVPSHLKEYPRTHLSIRFREPVVGPLCLGAGSGIGMGLLTVCERSGGALVPRERSI